MAAPPEVTIKDLSGKWVMNKTLSTDPDTFLALQGVGWLTRKAISIATVYLALKQYEEAGVVHIDIEQTATGGIKGTTELRALDWSVRKHDDHIFGSLTGQSRWSTFQEMDADDAFLKEGWLDGDEEKGGPNGEKYIESWVKNEEKGWDARAIWGFSLIDGKRYYTRKVVCRKGDKVQRVTVIYNYVGKE